jgi:hypothetical protein
MSNQPSSMLTKLLLLRLIRGTVNHRQSIEMNRNVRLMMEW